MSKLTDEQKKELASLEKEVKEELAADADDAEERHYKAMLLRKKYTAKGMKHGLDFAVLETKIGNFVIRKPKDTEIDTYAETSDRASGEAFVTSIMLEPTKEEVQAMFPANPGLVGAVNLAALELAKVARADEAKK